MSDEPVKECEVCGEPVKRLLFPVAIQFKGKGFYTTDYARKSSLGAAGCSAANGGNGGSSESGDSKGADGGGSEKSASGDTAKSTASGSSESAPVAAAAKSD